MALDAPPNLDDDTLGSSSELLTLFGDALSRLPDSTGSACTPTTGSPLGSCSSDGWTSETSTQGGLGAGESLDDALLPGLGALDVSSTNTTPPWAHKPSKPTLLKPTTRAAAKAAANAGQAASTSADDEVEGLAVPSDWCDCAFTPYPLGDVHSGFSQPRVSHGRP